MVWACDERHRSPVRRCERLAADGFRRSRGRPKKYWREVIRRDMKQFQLTEDMTLDRKVDPNGKALVPGNCSCGLWVLLHSLTVRVEDGESNLAFRTTCDFVYHFFVCEECRQHFHDMCTSVSSPFKKARDYALWLWSAHNKVNERLMKDEESPGTGDPEFPKVIWPPKQLCPSCYLNPGKTSDENSKIDWNKDEVFKFLVSYYGKELVNLYEDVKELQAGGSTQKTVNEELVASTDAVVVPLGAALAIAVASCAFGALACFWRSQQKNRKYKYLLFEEYITITYDNHSSREEAGTECIKRYRSTHGVCKIQIQVKRGAK
ncbi:Sulfhydryl oxidase 1 [Capsicum chinense]|nr:Sulfhydryl oxidase 1 [Capsicum chinense]